MNFNTNKQGVWIEENGKPKLIWEDELTEDMVLFNLELTPIDNTLYQQIKQSVYTQKFMSYYSTIVHDEDVINEIREKYQKQAEEEFEQDPSIDVESRTEELINSELPHEINNRIEILINEEVEKRLNEIKAENNYKLSLREKTRVNPIETELVEINEEDDKFLKSIEYLPDFLRDKPVFKDASKLLDVLISKSDNETLKQIYEAYVDTLYKYPGYEKLSYGARITLLQEKGFGYIVDLLVHMYDEDYEREVAQRKKEGTLNEMDSYEVFVQKKTDKALANITMLYNLLYILKGQTLGLELALQLVNVPSFVYFPWNIVSKEKGQWDDYETLPLPGGDIEVKKGDCYNIKTSNTDTWYMFNGVAWHEIDHPENYKRKRERFTATLDIRGLESNSHRTDLQKRISIFVKNYMLPYINVTVRYTHSVQPLYAESTRGRSLLTTFIADENEKVIDHKKLTHKVSDEGWVYTDVFDLQQINFGLGKNKRPFKGSAILSKSYVQDPDGTMHYLYGAKPTFAHIISGNAKEKATEDGFIDNYEQDYLQAPLRKKVDIDFVTGEQTNPYTEDGVFHRDTILRFFQTLVLESIHLDRTIQQMTAYEVTGSAPNIEDLPETEVRGACYSIGNTPIRYLYDGTEWVELSYPDLLVEDFEKEYHEAEVWLGRSTKLDLQSGYNHDLNELEIQNTLYEKYKQNLENAGTSQSEIRKKLQAATKYLELYNELKAEQTLYQKYLIQNQIDAILKENPELTQLTTYKTFFEFTTSKVETKEQEGEENTHLVFCEEKLDDKYTGIGELGILGSNDYFIYNGMILHHSDRLRQLGEEKNWLDIGSSHATSSDYYIPAILATEETLNEKRGCLKGLKGEEVLNVVRGQYHLENYKSHTQRHERIVVETVDDNMSNEDLDTQKIRTFKEDWFEVGEYWDNIEADKWTQVTGFINEFYSAFGICDGRLYKISLNPLHYLENEPTLVYEILDDDKEWTFVTGAAYFETYEAYGIKNKKLYRIDVNGIITEMKTEDIDTISGIENTIYNNNKLTYKVLNKPYETTKYNSIELLYKEVTEGETTYTTIDKVIFNNEEQQVTQDGNSFYTDNLVIHYSNENLESIFVETDLYRAYITFNNNIVTNYNLNERQEIIGWEDKISRYHHNNEDYFTYGVCNNDLYVINNKNIKKINDERIYTDVCGFYNEKSARTVAFALADGKLYKLENETVTLMDDRNWDEIHGCTVTYNTFVLGRSEGKIYKINARDIIELDDRNDWISIQGRITSSSTDTATCYGYAIRQTSQGKKLYEITRNGINIVSGFWKVDGKGQIQYLEDYNITNIKCNALNNDGTEIINIWDNEQQIKEQAIDENHSLSDYDIYVSYKTRGFDNNERYTIRSEVSDMNYVYIHPSQCRYHIYEDNCFDIFDTNTGLMSNFVTRNVEQIGGDVIGGNGTASRFKETNTYLIIPDVEDLNKIIISFSCTLEKGMNPIILDDYNCGVYYGQHNGVYGIYVMHQRDNQNVIELISSGNQGDIINSIATFNINGEHANISFSHTPNHFESSDINNDFVFVPRYLGGNGIIFGDASIHLKESMVYGEENIRLFDNGKYITIDTLEQDLSLNVITNKTQDTQKIIEVHGNNNDYELRMDELYSQLDVECTTNDLEVSTNYNDQLQHDPYEGTTYSTITYKGDYQLDENKVVQSPSSMDFKNLCDFTKSGIASNLNDRYNINFRLTNEDTEIKIRTGNEVENQVLFQTEENEAYTNKYLLESHISAISDVEVETVPSGIIYDLSTNKPQVIKRKIVFNNDHFNIDNSKIFNYGFYYFDDYQATLKFQPAETFDFTSGRYVYIDRAATIKLDMSNEIIDESTINTTKFKLNALKDDEKLFKLDNTFIKTITGDQYYKIDTTQHFVSYNNEIINEINHSQHDIEKDKLQYKNGKCSNYSKWRYHEIINVPTSLTLCVNNSDDTSINQCILGSSNSFGIIDNEWAIVKGNEIHKTGIIAYRSMNAYIKFEEGKVYYSENGFDYQILDEDFILDNITLGYGRMGSDNSYWNYLGNIDLSRSKADGKSLYLMDQTSVISRSIDDENYEIIETIESNYTVDEIQLGYEFTGTLDLYASNLLKPYELKWVENYQTSLLNTQIKTLDQAIKADISKADPDYKPEEDQNTYTMEEYGLRLIGTPQRWDEITVKYHTVDKAFYMQPNTEYTLKMKVEEDNESGSTLMNVIGEPTWNLGNVSDFENGYLTYILESERYIVVKFNLSGNDESLCCFLENDELQHNNSSPCIFVQNNKVKIFDNEVKDLFDINQDTCYLKLYNSLNKIEYSLDGETFIPTEVEREFTGYAPLAFGIGFINNEFKPLKGSVDLTKSYIFTDNKIELFKYYKKIFTYINDGEDHALTLEPLLTIKDYTTFASSFNGSIDFYESNLCLPNTRHWMANKISIYLDGVLQDTVIRDAINIEPIYTIQNEECIVDLDDLFVQINQPPEIGSQLLLTYNSWYLFRKKDTEYQFNVKHSDKTYLTWNEKDGQEHLILEMPLQKLTVNFGYEFNGTLSLIDSTRAQMKLCDYQVYYTYSIKYKKHSEENWKIWYEWVMEKANALYQRIGYSLKGTHYLESSIVQTEAMTTPFITFFDPEYITPVGNISFSPDRTGTVSSFDENSYLAMVMDKIEDGSIISFWINTSDDISDQEVGTFVKIKDRYFKDANDKHLSKVARKAKRNYTYILQYLPGGAALNVETVDKMLINDLMNLTIENFVDARGKVSARILGYNIGNYAQIKKPIVKKVSILPYNETYYTDNIDDLKIYYRKVIPGDYDHHTHSGNVTWYETSWIKGDVTYLKENLNIYYAQVPFGYQVNEGNYINQGEVEYNAGDIIEFKIVGKEIHYMQCIPYANMTLKMKAI